MHRHTHKPPFTWRRKNVIQLRHFHCWQIYFTRLFSLTLKGLHVTLANTVTLTLIFWGNYCQQKPVFILHWNCCCFWILIPCFPEGPLPPATPLCHRASGLTVQEKLAGSRLSVCLWTKDVTFNQALTRIRWYSQQITLSAAFQFKLQNKRDTNVTQICSCPVHHFSLVSTMQTSGSLHITVTRSHGSSHDNSNHSVIFNLENFTKGCLSCTLCKQFQ